MTEYWQILRDHAKIVSVRMHFKYQLLKRILGSALEYAQISLGLIIAIFFIILYSTDFIIIYRHITRNYNL